MTKTVSMIVAIGPKGLIGRRDKLVWKSKEDFLFFKGHTVNKPCIFGSTTFYGLPKYPLKNRVNIVLDNTQKEDITADNRGWVTCNSFECALLFCENYDEVFVCGGRSVYEYALKYNFINKVYLTRIYSKEIEEVANSNDNDLICFDIDKYIYNWSCLTLNEIKKLDTDKPLSIKFEVYEKKQ